MAFDTIVVTGGRDFGRTQEEQRIIFETLNGLMPLTIVQGGATGADYWAREWAFRSSRKVITFEAHWELEGKAAGPKRNRRMCEAHQRDLLVVFPGGRGTENCLKTAQSLSMRYIRVLP